MVVAIGVPAFCVLSGSCVEKYARVVLRMVIVHDRLSDVVEFDRTTGDSMEESEVGEP